MGFDSERTRCIASWARGSMSFDRYANEIVFNCDNCSDTNDTGEIEFNVALAAVKRDGWKVKHYRKEWCHYCPKCDPDIARNEFDVVR